MAWTGRLTVCCINELHQLEHRKDAQQKPLRSDGVCFHVSFLFTDLLTVEKETGRPASQRNDQPFVLGERVLCDPPQGITPAITQIY